MKRGEVSPAKRIGGAVLLIESVDRTRERVREALAEREVLTFEAERTSHAIDLIRRHAEEIDAAICEVGDPDAGWILAGRLRAERPGLPLLLTGPGASEDLLRRLLNEGPVERVCGRFGPRDLVEGLASLLGKS